MTHKFEIYRDRSGEYRVRFKYNSEVMWSSESYKNKKSVLDLINRIKDSAPVAEVEDTVNETRDLRRQLESIRIPASDRIVRLDHNSIEFKEFKRAFIKLEESLKRSNDIGEFNEDQIEVVRSEVSDLGRGSKKDWIRPAHVWNMAKSTLLWIMDHAAGSAIGALALALLAALAKALGLLN